MEALGRGTRRKWRKIEKHYMLTLDENHAKAKVK